MEPWQQTLARLIAIGLFFVSCATAFAQPAPTAPVDLDGTAAQHFQVAVQAYRAGQWEAARAEFQVCFDLSKRPDLLHNLSQVAEKQGRLADALMLEQDFLRLTQLSEAERLESTDRIARLEAEQRKEKQPVVATGHVAARMPNKIAIGGLVLGGGLLGGALLTTILGLRAKADLESRVVTLPELEAGRANATTYQALTITFGVVGVGLAAGSIAVIARKPK
jgi:hypothetical protein